MLENIGSGEERRWKREALKKNGDEEVRRWRSAAARKLDLTLSGVLGKFKRFFFNLICVDKLCIGLSCTDLRIYT